LPAIQDFTKWLASPDGTQTIRDLAQAIIDAIKNLVNFVGWVVKNKDAIAAFAGVVAVLYVGFKTITTATALWQAALVLFQTQVVTATGTTTAFATALKALPWFAVAAGVTLFVGSLSNYANEVYGSKVNTEGLTDAQAEQARRVESLKRLLGQYQYALENGTEANKQLAKDGIARVTAQLEAMGISAAGTAGEINRFNQIKLNGLRNELNATAGEMNRFRNIAKGFVAPNATPTPDPTPNPFGGGGGGPSAFEQVQKIIKDAQKKLGEAQKTYREALANAKKDYDKTIVRASKAYEEAITNAEKDRDKSLAAALKAHNQNIASIQADFAKRQADIITQSINRLRDAYATSVKTNIASLFESDDIGKSIDNLVKNLRDRLTASRELVANAAKLASGGFSQTFIEQIVGAGLQTGNELATAILTATPETQAELKSLFGTLETESETGMDSLDKTIY
jgi:tetratricopeptide (TPR) repeat protein